MGVLFYIWLMVMIVTVIVEIATTELTSFWFSIGSLATLILNLFVKDNFVWGQVLVFAIVSVLCIIFIKPIIKKKFNVPTLATNIDSLIGKKAVVTSLVSIRGNGAVKIEGVEWTAFTDEPTDIIPGEIVLITNVSGNKLKVKKN